VFEHEKCLTCGLCCRGTEMVLTPSDIARLEALGFRRDLFVEVRGGLPRLRNVNGHCVFFDERSGRCLVYPQRPAGCRVYPLVFDEEKGVTFDRECPLSAEFSARKHEVVRAVAELEKVLRELERSYGFRVNWRLFGATSRRLI